MWRHRQPARAVVASLSRCMSGDGTAQPPRSRTKARVRGALLSYALTRVPTPADNTVWEFWPKNAVVLPANCLKPPDTSAVHVVPIRSTYSGETLTLTITHGFITECSTRRSSPIAAARPVPARAGPVGAAGWAHRIRYHQQCVLYRAACSVCRAPHPAGAPPDGAHPSRALLQRSSATREGGCACAAWLLAA